jgi:hypothetical protein
MSEENNSQTEQTEELEPQENGSEETEPPKRGFFTRRTAGIAAGVLGLLLILVVVLVFVSYRTAFLTIT